jgi:hypothetical protein
MRTTRAELNHGQTGLEVTATTRAGFFFSRRRRILGWVSSYFSDLEMVAGRAWTATSICNGGAGDLAVMVGHHGSEFMSIFFFLVFFFFCPLASVLQI